MYSIINKYFRFKYLIRFSVLTSTFCLGFITAMVLYDQYILSQVDKHNMIVTSYYEDSYLEVPEKLKRSLIKKI